MIFINEISNDNQLFNLIKDNSIVILLLYKAKSLYDDNEYEESQDFLKYIQENYLEYSRSFVFVKRSSSTRIYYDICSFPAVVIFQKNKLCKIVKKEDFKDLEKIFHETYWNYMSENGEIYIKFNLLKHLYWLWGKFSGFFSRCFRARRKANKTKKI